MLPHLTTHDLVHTWHQLLQESMGSAGGGLAGGVNGCGGDGGAAGVPKRRAGGKGGGGGGGGGGEGDASALSPLPPPSLPELLLAPGTRVAVGDERCEVVESAVGYVETEQGWTKGACCAYQTLASSACWPQQREVTKKRVE